MLILNVFNVFSLVEFSIYNVNFNLYGYTVHQTMLKPFYYQLMHIMLKNTELLKHSKIT